MEKVEFYIDNQKFFVMQSCFGGLSVFATLWGMDYYIGSCLTVSQAQELAKIWLGA